MHLRYHASKIPSFKNKYANHLKAILPAVYLFAESNRIFWKEFSIKIAKITGNCKGIFKKSTFYH